MQFLISGSTSTRYSLKLCSLRTDLTSPHNCDNVVEDKEICLLFATGHMEQRKHSGELLFDDIVNDCDILLTILKFMADKPEQIPMYVVTSRS
jgi:hypothetical protein